MLQDGMMSFALLGAEWVLWLLVGMSVLCIAIAVERGIYLVRDATDAQGLQAAFDALGEGSREQFGAALARLTGYEARVLKSGVGHVERGIEAAEYAMLSTVTAEKVRMERGLSVLATVGSNAPFIGLFGTVLGIMKAFKDLATATEEASDAVMAGIAEALVATAVGLLVAIPAVMLYNAFIRMVKARQSRAESLANLVLARFGGEAVSHGK